MNHLPSDTSKNEELGLPTDTMREVKIAFDIDGTLRNNTKLTPSGGPVPNEDIRTLLRILRKFKNTHIIVWSGSGELYARQVSDHLGIQQWVHQYGDKRDWLEIKPDIAIDDIQDTAIGLINLIVREK